MGKGFRCFSYALIGIALMLVSVQTARAHVDPAGATGSGVSISLTAFRNDGTTPVLPGHIFQCETIIYRATLAYAGTVNGVVNGAIEGGTLTITTPDAVAHDVTPAGGIPCLGGTFNDPVHPTTGQCFGAPTAINSNTVSYTGSACVTTASASVTYANGIAHIAVDDLTGVGATTPLNISVDCCPSDNNACNGLEFCNPAKTYSVSGGTNNALGTCDVGPAPPPCVANACNTAACDPVTGNCVQTPVSDSTACTDTDGNNCTTAGCEAGACVQAHVTTPCTPTNECNTAACDATHTCVQTPKSDSTACTDTDGNNCTTAGCEAGLCAQAHVTTPCTPTNECNTAACDATHTCVQTPKSDSTACTDTDGNNCTTAGCEAGVCAQTHVTTPCTALNDCNTAACNAEHVCVQTPKSDSTVCADTDGNACTTAGCEAGSCVQTHVTTPCTPVNECNTAACNPASGQCVQTPKEDSTACTDNDAVECTTAGCEAGSCVQTHISNCGLPGRMTGGGSVFTKANGRVTHGFELHCDPEVGPNNLEINWGPGNHFHLEDLTSAVCTDDPNIAPPPPPAGFDTYNGTGTG
ncbi:MAG: hypothetical protein DMF54_03455, partial [Acidobacteria bacterium]